MLQMSLQHCCWDSCQIAIKTKLPGIIDIIGTISCWFYMKCFTHAALCILKRDSSLRILSTDASGCFFTNVTFTAVAEIGIRGEFCEELSYIHWVQLVFRSPYLIVNWHAYTFILHIHVKYEYRIPFMIWKLQTTFSNVSSMKVLEFRLQFHWSLFPRVLLIVSQHWFRYWIGAEQARSHHPNQSWPSSPTHIYGIRGVGVK